MTRKVKARLLFPDDRLARLLTRAHGRARTEALREGAIRLAAGREQAMRRLEAGPHTPGRLAHIARDSDRIVTLAATFGLVPLADTARRLCDMTAILARRDAFDLAALNVHIRALRLFAPGSPVLNDAQAATVLGRIAALAAHLSAHLPPR